LYIQGFSKVEALMKQHGLLTDAQVWSAVSPVILNHVESQIRANKDPNSDPNTIAADIIAAKTGIPADMVMPTWQNLVSQPGADVSFMGLSRCYRQNSRAILSETLGYPLEAMQPVVLELAASGMPLSQASFLPLWEQRARSMPTHWF
jgi:hypothetical protein